MKNPKANFLQSPHAKTFLEVVVRADFQVAIATALLQMLNEQPMQTMAAGSTDLTTAAANQFRMEGARRFVSILLTLPEPSPVRQAPVMPDNLEP